MPQSYSSPRLLMNRLRQLMAEGGQARERLEKIVEMIAGTMIADVCSIYLRTVDDELELVATEGLRSEAVASTRLRMDEGLVGHIARSAAPLSIQDAPRHPDFSYRPETGEDPYHAFLGVPILRGGRVAGVLTVQNRTERIYDEAEVESLETIAMVLAEIVAADPPRNTSGSAGVEVRPSRPVRMTGNVLCEGLGMGQARLHDPVVPAAKFFAADSDAEGERLDDALMLLRQAVDKMLTAEGGGLWGDPRDVLEAYRMLANDPSWAERLHDGIKGGLTAEASIDRARREHRARLESARDSYLRERLHDLEDLDNRLLRILGGDQGHGQKQGKAGDVLIARRLGPAELLEYNTVGLTAILLEEGAATSHAAIVARALGIPTIGGLDDLTTKVETGDKVVVDAEEGIVHLRPEANVLDAYKSRAALRKQRQASYRRLAKSPARTKDGVDMDLMLNAGLQLDLDHMAEIGVDGIGLFRTEFQFLVSERLPRLEEQIELYRDVITIAGNKPVLFRTLDLGGDKILPNYNHVREENPALGWRSIRFALDRKGLFRRQLRALIRAVDGGPLSVMFPMVTTAAEFFEAKTLLLEEMRWSRKKSYPVPSKLSVGAMLEVPAFAYSLEAIATEADFISVGTNDLMQFFFAADRMTPDVSARYDILSQPALDFLGFIAKECTRLDLPVSVCGEATGKPLEALALIGLGYRRFSMRAGGIGPVKRMIRSLKLKQFETDFTERLAKSNGAFRNDLLAMSRDHAILLTDS